jgi:alkylhydroperoxidase/carboxymuconolactone decarboxylase family protein YurZ
MSSGNRARNLARRHRPKRVKSWLQKMHHPNRARQSSGPVETVSTVDVEQVRAEGWSHDHRGLAEPGEHRGLAEPAEQLLRGLASGDETLIRSVLVLAPPLAPRPRSLPAGTAALVHLAALLAVGASTTSLRWAVERALHAGAHDEQVVEVLTTVAAAVGSARVVAEAPRLALAIGYDIQIEVCDGY